MAWELSDPQGSDKTWMNETQSPCGDREKKGWTMITQLWLMLQRDTKSQGKKIEISYFRS